MLNLREDALFTSGKSISAAFNGFHLTTSAPIKNDGANFSRKIGIIKIVTIPADGETMVVGGKTYTFKNTALTTTQIKIGNLVTNGDFAAAGTGWSAPYWTIDVTGALHIAGNHTVPVHRLNPDDDTFTETDTVDNVQSLTQEWFPKPIAGYSYVTVFTVSGRSAGSVKVKIGGVLGTLRNTNATFTETIVATSDGYLEFVPTADFDGKISAITVTETHTDLKGLTAKAICDKINADTATTLCTAYQGASALGLTTEIAIVANLVDSTPTLTVDGVKITNPIALTLFITEAQLENTDYWKRNITTEADVKPTVLVERNAGTDKNFLY